MRLFCAVLLALFMAACADLERQPEPAATPEAAAEPPQFKNSTLKYLAGRNLKPQPTRPLNVKSSCAHRDAIGTQTRLNLLVREAEVKTFAAEVTMKGRGTCRFNLGEFEQAEKLPQALLRHKREKECSVRMWEQGSRVTVAFNGCPKSCEGDAFSYLWPIMVEAKSGRCF